MPTIRVEVPRSHHPLTVLRMKHSQGESVTEVDVDAMSEVEIELPEGVTPEEVEIVGEFSDARGQRDEGMDLVVVKAASKAEPQAKRPGRKAKADEKSVDPPVIDTPAADKPVDDKPADDGAKS